MYITQDIAKRIKSRLKTQQTNTKTMLSDLNMGINAISEFSKGSQMSCISLARIADYLDCSVDYLLGRTEQPSSTVNNIEGNVTGNAVMQGSHSSNVTVTNGASALTEEETELLRLFQSLDVKKRVKILNFCYSLEDETPVG